MADEYIKREDAKKQMARFIGYIGIDDDMVERFKIALNSIPAEDVAPVRHGKWYTKSLTRRGGHGEAYFVYGCSICKKKVRYKTDFCPNCGADMRKDGW